MNNTVRKLAEEIGDHIRQTPVPQPPEFGEARRGAVDSLITDLSDNICTQIKTLHDVLDDMQTELLNSSDRAKLVLQDHVALGVRLNDEISHTRKVIAELRALIPPLK